MGLTQVQRSSTWLHCIKIKRSTGNYERQSLSVFIKSKKKEAVYKSPPQTMISKSSMKSQV